MNQCDHLRFNGNRPRVGCGKVCMSMKNGRFRGWETFLGAVGQKKGCLYGRRGVFEVGGQDKWRFSGRKVADKKETPSKGCLRNMYTI